MIDVSLLGQPALMTHLLREYDTSSWEKFSAELPYSIRIETLLRVSVLAYCDTTKWFLYLVSEACDIALIELNDEGLPVARVTADACAIEQIRGLPTAPKNTLHVFDTRHIPISRAEKWKWLDPVAYKLFSIVRMLATHRAREVLELLEMITSVSESRGLTLGSELAKTIDSALEARK